MFNLLELKKNMEEFMKRNKLEDDAFMQKLVTDVYVAYTGMTNPFGAAFIGSRLSSQGRQQAYDINNFDGLAAADFNNIFPPRGNLRRCSQPAPCTRGLGLAKETSAPMTIMAPPIMSLRQTSCYTTATQATAMRCCSQQVPNEDVDTDEEDAN